MDSKNKVTAEKTKKADSNNKVTAEKTTKADSKIIDLEPSKIVHDKEKNLKKEKKKKENVNKSRSNQKIKRKRIQTFDSSDEEIDSEEEGMCRKLTYLYLVSYECNSILGLLCTVIKMNVAIVC